MAAAKRSPDHPGVRADDAAGPGARPEGGWKDAPPPSRLVPLGASGL